MTLMLILNLKKQFNKIIDVKNVSHIVLKERKIFTLEVLCMADIFP